MNLARQSSALESPWLSTPQPVTRSGIAPKLDRGSDGSIDVEIPSAEPGLVGALRGVPRWLLTIAIGRWVFVHVFVVCAMIGMLLPSSDAPATGTFLRTNTSHDASGTPHAASAVGCTLIGEPKRVAVDAQAAAGVEVGFVGEDPALAFLRNDGEAVALSLEASTLAPKANAHRASKAGTKRAMPVDVDGTLDVAIDSAPDRKLVPQADGYLSVSKKKDGLALAVLGSNGNTLGVPAKVARGAAQLGTPTLASVGDAALVAWAERAGDGPWQLQLLQWKPGQAPGAPVAVASDAISPGLVPAGSDRALLVWSDGPVSAHRVRAQLFDHGGAALGVPATLSPEGVNAGAPRAVVSRQGQGFVSYFVASGETIEVWAARMSCALGSGYGAKR